MKRLLVVLAAATALICAGFSAVAVAHTVRFDSTVTIHKHKNAANPDSLDGRVSSDKARCVRNRTVKVKQRVSGPDVLTGTDTTDANGNWEFTFAADAPAGTYYAVATRKVLRHSAHHFHICTRAVSRDVTVH